MLADKYTSTFINANDCYRNRTNYGRKVYHKLIVTLDL